METQNFYRHLPSFREFAGITDDANYRAMPEDWTVVITDVKGSTKAIEAGRYKDVNTIGAASIAAIQNALGEGAFPFVFGGDGATAIIPPGSVDAVKRELVSLKSISVGQFGLELRVGMVGVGEILREGARIDVAKFELIAGKCVASFKGGGLTNAEKKVKGQPEKYEVTEQPTHETDLKGLSCRWQPIPNKRGRVLSLLVAARRDNGAEIYQNILGRLSKLFDGALDEANPVNIPQMSYKSVSECIANEKRYHENKWSPAFLARVFEILAAVAIFKFNIPPIFFNPQRYANSMRTHSDYRKFDDMLRMIIDCSPEQKQQIIDFLEPMYRAGDIFYGVHESETSLMTCYVQDLNDGNHIHFIDGGDGGYAMAAKQLKSQIKSAG